MEEDNQKKFEMKISTDNKTILKFLDLAYKRKYEKYTESQDLTEKDKLRKELIDFRKTSFNLTYQNNFPSQNNGGFINQFE